VRLLAYIRASYCSVGPSGSPAIFSTNPSLLERKRLFPSLRIGYFFASLSHRTICTNWLMHGSRHRSSLREIVLVIITPLLSSDILFGLRYQSVSAGATTEYYCFRGLFQRSGSCVPNIFHNSISTFPSDRIRANPFCLNCAPLAQISNTSPV
jgi:hypothetical protein